MSSEKVGLGLVLIGVRPIFAATDRHHRLALTQRRNPQIDKCSAQGRTAESAHRGLGLLLGAGCECHCRHLTCLNFRERTI
jgi:hypothetical protein